MTTTKLDQLISALESCAGNDAAIIDFSMVGTMLTHYNVKDIRASVNANKEHGYISMIDQLNKYQAKRGAKTRFIFVPRGCVEPEEGPDLLILPWAKLAGPRLSSANDIIDMIADTRPDLITRLHRP